MQGYKRLNSWREYASCPLPFAFPKSHNTSSNLMPAVSFLFFKKKKEKKKDAESAYKQWELMTGDQHPQMDTNVKLEGLNWYLDKFILEQACLAGEALHTQAGSTRDPGNSDESQGSPNRGIVTPVLMDQPSQNAALSWDTGEAEEVVNDTPCRMCARRKEVCVRRVLKKDKHLTLACQPCNRRKVKCSLGESECLGRYKLWEFSLADNLLIVFQHLFTMAPWILSISLPINAWVDPFGRPSKVQRLGTERTWRRRGTRTAMTEANFEVQSSNPESGSTIPAMTAASAREMALMPRSRPSSPATAELSPKPQGVVASLPPTLSPPLLPLPTMGGEAVCQPRQSTADDGDGRLPARRRLTGSSSGEMELASLEHRGRAGKKAVIDVAHEMVGMLGSEEMESPMRAQLASMVQRLLEGIGDVDIE
jgi:hypothetical protein